jgi:hypothetical protein
LRLARRHKEMTEPPMLARLIPVLLLLLAAPAFAADDKGPLLSDLMKQKGYVYAWDSMLSGETPPSWIGDYAKTLDGPPVPTIPVPLDGETYTLGFICKANDCEDNQLYVLFAPGQRDAWGLLASDGKITWLGRPGERIQDAIRSGLRR